MGSAKQRPDGKWRARWRDLGGKEHAKHFALKRDANAFLATMEADKLRGQYVDPTDKTTVAQYARRWASTRPHNPRTARRVDSQIRNHIEGTRLGGQRMAKVLPSDAQAWVTDRSLVLAPLTLRNLVYLVRSIFGAAVGDRLIGRSPFTKSLSVPESDEARIVPLTVDQVRQLAEAMPDRGRAPVIVQAGLGLRAGELLALRVQDIDFLRRAVRVETQFPSGESTRTKPKTRTSVRPLPLPQFVAEALAAQMRAFPPAEDGSVFTSIRGTALSQSRYGQMFAAAVRAVGLPAGTTSHDLRHHYASVLLYAGESVIAVAERLGHKNGNLVLSTYGHLMPDSEDRTRANLERAWSTTNADSVRTVGPLRAV